MAETSIQRALRLTRERQAARAEAEAQLSADEIAKVADGKEEGFFSSFFKRDETIDEAVEAAQGRQSTDSSQ